MSSRQRFKAIGQVNSRTGARQARIFAKLQDRQRAEVDRLRQKQAGKSKVLTRSSGEAGA